MADIRLVSARQLVCDKEAWRKPAYLGLVIYSVQQILDSETECRETRAEAEMLMKKLRLAGKAPPLGQGFF